MLQLTCKKSSLPTSSVEKAFEKDIEENQLLIYKICRIYAASQMERDDLYQEIVLQLWQSYPKFRGESKFSTWLYRIAINTALSGFRRQKQFIKSYEPEMLPTRAEEPQVDLEEKTRDLYHAIDRLNEIEKAIIVLYLEDRTYDEMEQILGMSNGALRVKMNRIKEKLRKLTKQI